MKQALKFSYKKQTELYIIAVCLHGTPHSKSWFTGKKCLILKPLTPALALENSVAYNFLA
jgi:hypothetical protein